MCESVLKANNIDFLVLGQVDLVKCYTAMATNYTYTQQSSCAWHICVHCLIF